MAAIIDHSNEVHPESATTYDVTAVSEDRQYVPLTASASYSAAVAIAQARSQDAHWSALLVKDARSGLIVATYVDGKRHPA